MRKLSIVTLFLLAFILMGARPVVQNRALGTLLDDVALNAAEATRTTTVRTLPGYNQLHLFIAFTHSAATDVKATCRSYYDDTDSTAYVIQSGDATTWPTVKYDDWDFTKDVTGDVDYVLSVPLIGYKVDCVFSGTSAGASDKVTVKARAVAM